MSCSQSDSCIPVRREESGWGVLEEGGGWMGVLSRDATSSQCVKSIFSSVNRGIPAHWSWLCSQGFEVGDCQSVRCWMWMNDTCIKPFLSASTITPLPSPRPVIMNTAPQINQQFFWLLLQHCFALHAFTCNILYVFDWKICLSFFSALQSHSDESTITCFHFCAHTLKPRDYTSTQLPISLAVL